MKSKVEKDLAGSLMQNPVVIRIRLIRDVASRLVLAGLVRENGDGQI